MILPNTIDSKLYNLKEAAALLANEGSLATISTSLCKSIWFSSFGSVFLSHKESIEAAK